MKLNLLLHNAANIFRRWRLLGLGEEESWRKIPRGLWMKINPRDFMDQKFYFGNYEPVLIQLISKLVRPGEVCVDIGAHKGYITLYMAKAVGNDGLIISFEPDPSVYKKLRENCIRNKFNHAIIFQQAAGAESGKLKYRLSHQAGFSSFFPSESAKPLIDKTIEVETRTVDQVLAELGISPKQHRISLVKIDAEGSEPLVLRGMARSIEKFTPLIWIEINPDSLKAGNFSAKNIEETLLKYSYDLYRIDVRTDKLFRLVLSLNKINDIENNIMRCEDILAVVRGTGYYDRLSAWLAKPFIKHARII